MANVKMMSPNTRIDFYPVNAFADPANPTAAELNAGTNISCAIAQGYTLNFTASDTDDSKTICDEGNVQNRGFSNYEASLPFFLSPIGATDQESLTFQTAYNLFSGNERVEGYLVSRQGFKSTIPYDEGQHINIFHVMSDLARITVAEGAAPQQFEVPFLPQGFAIPNYEIPA